MLILHCLVFDDQSHEAQIAAGFRIFDGVSFAARTKHGVAGLDGNFLSIVAVEALPFKNVVGFAFPVVFVMMLAPMIADFLKGGMPF